MKFPNINIKEPYKTGIIIGLTTFTVLGVAYILLPNSYRTKMNDFIKAKLSFKKKTDEGTNTTTENEVEKPV